MSKKRKISASAAMAESHGPVYRFFEKLFGIDLRALAAFRVAISGLILVDLAIRVTDLRAFYTDAGVLPRELLWDAYSHRFFLFCLHSYSGSALWQGVLFAVAAIFAVCLLVGYRTRWTGPISWLLLMSLQLRNPMILQAGDTLIRMLLFWALFLPMGARFSVDAALDDSPRQPPRRVFNPASAALLLQMFMMYFFTYLLKDGQNWKDGTALFYALSVDQFTRPLGQWMVQFHDLNRVSTYATIWLEAIGPFLPFLPLFTKWFRGFAILSFGSLHVGIAMTMDVGLFSYISLIGWLPYLPTEFWDFWQRRFDTRSGEGLTLFFDGDCGFCKKAVLVIRVFAMLPKAEVVSAQADPGAAELMDAHHSWVVRTPDGTMHVEFPAFVAICRAAPLWRFVAPILALGPMVALGNRAYRLVADRRRLFSKITRRMKYRPRTWKSNPVAQGFVVVCLVYVFAWNVRTVEFDYWVKYFPRSWNWYGNMIRLDQYWSMFAPNPTKVDGWFLIPAKLEDGTQVDLYADGGEVNYAKPEVPCYQHRNMRWRKYMMNLKILKNKRHREPFSEYFCSSWDRQAEPARHVTSLELVFMREYSKPPDIPPDKPQRISLLHYESGSYRGKP
ncbi:DUF393 domain-containing protein [Sulfidibacter corallicola]|uniref:DUF393 domain-containing protein n=1 Tax=Sulfidibacter corallicola TaxID=2818388 RepID=A0A8A4TRS5_SULCO|nr:DCC1-like thiol-disulfide oxidoreductase family protein [Sulfidibacter corallicola]QTD51772.1 DUF393 domain-containing protein [Sulfidibacter corallicola]